MKMSLAFKLAALLLIAWAVFMMNPDWPIWGDAEYVDYHGYTIWNEPKTLSHLISGERFSDPLLITSLYGLGFLYLAIVFIAISFIIFLVLLIGRAKQPIVLDIVFLSIVLPTGIAATVFLNQAMDHGNYFSMVYSVFPAIAAVLCAIPLILRLTMRKKEN